MSGVSNFPTALDDDASLHDVVDGSTALIAAHHNNIKEAIKGIQAKVGIYNTSAPTALDFRLGHPTEGHSHNGASGQGPLIVENARRHVVQMFAPGTQIATSNSFIPVVVGRNLMLESVQGALRRGPSGATALYEISFGATGIWDASPGYRVAFAPGATAFRSVATPNYISYPSGLPLQVDTVGVGSSYPGLDASITFIFREYDE